MQSREPLNNNTQELPIIDTIKEKKVFIIFGLSTIAILVGAVFFLSKGNNSSVPKEDIVASNGLHWHPRLAVYLNGKKQEFTDSIGLGAVHQPIHTHAEDYKDGVVHMEMQGVVTKDQTKLGRFFEIWGKEFSSTKIFDKTNGNDGKVKMIVNGEENAEFEDYKMRNKDNIEIRYE